MKRWTATEKWGDRFFRRLVPTSKIFFLYLLDNCDDAGVWEEDFETFAFQTGIDVCRDALLEDMGDRVVVLPGDKILVPKFLPFQQPKGLKEHVRFHEKIAKRLEVHGLQFMDDKVTLKGDSSEGRETLAKPSREGAVVVMSKSKSCKKGGKGGKVETIPAALDCPEFRQAWDEFKTYRSTEKKNKLTKLGATRILNLLEKTPDKAIKALELSMTQGYTGVDPEWINGNPPGRRNDEPDRDYENALEF